MPHPSEERTVDVLNQDVARFAGSNRGIPVAKSGGGDEGSAPGRKLND